MKSTVLPIWSTDSVRPAMVRLIDGMTELLLCLDIIRKRDASVVFGSDHFRAGQGELETMTYNEKHHWVVPLGPTACAYTKLSGYFREMQKEQIEILQVRGDFGDHLEVRKVTKSKSQKIIRGSWEMQIDYFGNEMRYRIRLRKCRMFFREAKLGKLRRVNCGAWKNFII